MPNSFLIWAIRLLRILVHLWGSHHTGKSWLWPQSFRSQALCENQLLLQYSLDCRQADSVWHIVSDWFVHQPCQSLPSVMEHVFQCWCWITSRYIYSNHPKAASTRELQNYYCDYERGYFKSPPLERQYRIENLSLLLYLEYAGKSRTILAEARLQHRLKILARGGMFFHDNKLPKSSI